MTLHLLRGRWWSIVCPHSGVLLNCQKGCIHGAVRTMLPELIHPQWCIRLHVVHLVNKGPSGSPDTQSWSINILALCMPLRVRQEDDLKPEKLEVSYYNQTIIIPTPHIITALQNTKDIISTEGWCRNISSYAFMGLPAARLEMMVLVKNLYVLV